MHDAFALPRAFYDEGVRRYGFRGLSREYVTDLRAIAPSEAAGRVVVAHLGNGASMCAIRDGLSVASTMSFTALDGLAMGTRCGKLDPGVVLLLQEEKLDAGGARSSALRGVGIAGALRDMRELEASDTPQARQAIDYFVSRVRYELGGLAATLERLDALVFCGGIGENSWCVRERVLEGMQWLGLESDAAANRASARVISTPASRVPAYVIRMEEYGHTASQERSN